MYNKTSMPHNRIDKNTAKEGYMKKESWITLAAGAAAGGVNGFFGGGAGMLLVPMLMKLNKMDAKKASATSLGITLVLSFVTLAVYLFDGGMPSIPVLPFVLGGTAGAVRCTADEKNPRQAPSISAGRVHDLFCCEDALCLIFCCMRLSHLGQAF
jgi:uncharacterized membrane protein YfcA